MKPNNIEKAYQLARQRYAELGVDTEKVLHQLARISISIHCWQGDDVGGFENAAQELGGGLAVTGNYPGKARTSQELRADFEKVLSLVPGKHRFSVVRMLQGHGIGRTIHEEPMIPNWADPDCRGWLREGLVITVEPIIAMGSGDMVEDKDGWTIRTRDGSLAAHFEHTLVVTKGAPLLLTAA